ncbi:MAG: hypothetical protein Q9169_007820 [Polycauliona sp. 2 TL-2023]
MFKGYCVRVPSLNRQDAIVPGSGPEIRRVESTTATLKRLLHSHENCVANNQTMSTPFESLLTIIVHDTLKVLQFINLTLSQVDSEMLDDVLVQVQIDGWRAMLHRFEHELRDMESSLPEFARSILTINMNDSRSQAGKGSKVIRELLGRLRKQVTQAQVRTESTHRSLMTTMSLIESKRGISEAESVTKLTELAFFFIPLTFAASLFSMQVKELDAETTSVGVFVTVALAVTICSYALRLVIRGAPFLSLTRRWKDKIRADQKIRPSAPIATSAALQWIWRRINTHIWPVYMMIPMATLLSMLWTRPLQEGMKTGITITLALMCLATVLLLVLMRTGVSEKWARKLRKRLPR